MRNTQGAAEASQSIKTVEERLAHHAKDIGISTEELTQLCLKHGLDALETTGITIRKPYEPRTDVRVLNLSIPLELVFAAHKKANNEGQSIETMVAGLLVRHTLDVDLDAAAYEAMAEECRRNEKTTPVHLPKNAVALLEELCEAADIEGAAGFLSRHLEQWAADTLNCEPDWSNGLVELIETGYTFDDQGAVEKRLRAIAAEWEADEETIVRRKAGEEVGA